MDAKHNIPIDFKVTNQNDNKAMGGMVRRAKTILRNNDFTALYDKGYHTGGEFDYADKQEVEVIVAIPDPGSQAPDQAFNVKHFTYDKISDSYTCPAGHTLTSNGNQYDKIRSKSINKVKHYKTNQCQWMAVIFVFRACEAHYKAISRSNYFITRNILLFFNTRISILLPNFIRVLRLEIAFKDGF